MSEQSRDALRPSDLIIRLGIHDSTLPLLCVRLRCALDELGADPDPVECGPLPFDLEADADEVDGDPASEPEPDEADGDVPF
jgi:hypothetical protein